MGRDRVTKSDVHIPHTVITTLGRIAVLSLIGSFVLILHVVRSPAELDAVTATLITGFMGIGSNAAVALGAILATTNRAPTPVTVENKPSEPIPTTDSGVTGNPPAIVDPDAPAESDL